MMLPVMLMVCLGPCLLRLELLAINANGTNVRDSNIQHIGRIRFATYESPSSTHNYPYNVSTSSSDKDIDVEVEMVGHLPS